MIICCVVVDIILRKNVLKSSIIVILEVQNHCTMEKRNEYLLCRSDSGVRRGKVLEFLSQEISHS